MMEDTEVFLQTEIGIDENELSIPFTVQNFYSTFDKYELHYSAEDLKLIKEYINK